jgi:hypothetical protein
MGRLLTGLLALIMPLAPAGAQVHELTHAEIERQILAHDRILFEDGFNHCRLAPLAAILAEDLEFYHDLAGPSFGPEPFLDAMRRNICSASGDGKPIRRLDQASVEVHPLYRNGELYGAIQTGAHAFYLGRGEAARLTSTARFTHLWLLDGEGWLLARVLSYDHETPGSE